VGIDPTLFDVVIFGDGSGSGWDLGCGWAAVHIDLETGHRQVFHGACTPGTIGIGEIMPYLHALTWHAATQQAGKRIAVITDSQYVAKTGTMDRKVTVKANWWLWSQFDWLKRQGFRIKWHWVRRDDTALNKFTDALSRLARLTLTKTNLAEAVEMVEGVGRINVYRRNP
jgi:ribonuclease HI